MARNGVDFRNVCMSYMVNPTCGGLEDYRQKNNVNQKTFQRALDHLESEVENAVNSLMTMDDLVPFRQWMVDTFDIVGDSETEETEESPGRGRPGPKAGTERMYRVQRIGNDPPFIRLPVNPLNCRKGSPVRVRFDGEEIRVSRAT